MISLDVENYCQECPKFEPVCTKYYYGTGNATTYVSCKHKGVCANLKQYIEQQIARKEHYEIPCSN